MKQSDFALKLVEKQLRRNEYHFYAVCILFFLFMLLSYLLPSTSDITQMVEESENVTQGVGDEGNLVSDEVTEKTIIPVEKTREVTKTVVVSQYQIVEIPVRILTYEDVRQARASAYEAEVDPLMSQYSRKKTFNLFEGNEEAELLAKIEAKVEEIKARYPYPADAKPTEGSGNTVVELYSMEI